MNILIIEDDNFIAGMINKTLSGYGYNCENAYDGEEAEELIDRKNWDIILLDIMLPKVSGYELLEYINSTCKTPVIIISAMNQVDDKIRGLRMGADDYLGKPFQVGELIARVEAVLRRTNPSSEVFSYQGVEVDFSSRRVLKDGEEVMLTAKEFELLNMLIINKNVALSRETLYEGVWKEEYLGETRTLDNHIKSLRQKLGYENVIQTVFRIGYRLDIRDE
jgi:DNA-binding response OmpR family regulator